MANVQTIACTFLSDDGVEQNLWSRIEGDIIAGPANCEGLYAKFDDGTQRKIMSLAPGFGPMTLEPWAKDAGFKILDDGESKGGGSFRVQMPSMDLGSEDPI